MSSRPMDLCGDNLSLDIAHYITALACLSLKTVLAGVRYDSNMLSSSCKREAGL